MKDVLKKVFKYGNLSGSDLKLMVQDALDVCTPEQLRDLAEITLLLLIGQKFGCLDSFLTLLGFTEVSAE